MREDDPTAEATGLLTVTEAAQRAGVSPWTISGWITGGRLPAVLIAGRRRIRPTDLARLRGRSRRLDPRYRG